jgi:hypothetical protein
MTVSNELFSANEKNCCIPWTIVSNPRIVKIRRSTVSTSRLQVTAWTVSQRRGSIDGTALLISGGLKTESSKIRESGGGFFRLTSVITFISSGGSLLPDFSRSSAAVPSATLYKRFFAVGFQVARENTRKNLATWHVDF